MEEKPVSIQLYSDVHLDYRGHGLPRVAGKADYLLLAGDIGRAGTVAYRLWLLRVASMFKQVLMVSGNHEYYNKPNVPKWAMGKTMKEIDGEQEILCEKINERVGKDRVVYLGGMGKSVRIANGRYKVIGGTLWTDVPKELEGNAGLLMTDYTTICSDPGKLVTPSELTDMHHKTLDFIKTELAEPNCPPTIILTHHAPLLEASDTPYSDVLHCYCTDLEKMAKPPIVMWAFGHTHIPFDKTINGTRFISRPWEVYKNTMSISTKQYSSPILLH